MTKANRIPPDVSVPPRQGMASFTQAQGTQDVGEMPIAPKKLKQPILESKERKKAKITSPPTTGSRKKKRTISAGAEGRLPGKSPVADSVIQNNSEEPVEDPIGYCISQKELDRIRTQGVQVNVLRHLFRVLGVSLNSMPDSYRQELFNTVYKFINAYPDPAIDDIALTLYEISRGIWSDDKIGNIIIALLGFEGSKEFFSENPLGLSA